MSSRVLLAISLLLTTFATGTPSALGQGNGSGQFGISPARRDVAARPPVRLVPTRVANTTDTPMDVTVFSAFIAQQTDGSFTFSEKPADLRAANNVLTPGPTSFRLNPGDVRMVSLTWNTLPPKARAAYMGVIFQGIPIINGKRNLRVTNRLLSINFLRLPGHYRSSGKFDGMQVRQAPEPKVLRFIPRVWNTGQIHDVPKNGRLVIETAAGKKLFTQRWTGDVVLPGVKRDFIIDVRRVFPKGRYIAAAVMDFGRSHHQVVRTPFTLTAPNTLPSGQIAVGDFAASGIIDKPAHLTASVSNPGTAPAGTTISLALFQVDGPNPDKPVATRRVPIKSLGPKQTTKLDEQLGKVEKGHYRAVLRYRDSTDVVRTLTAEFDGTKEKSFWDKVKRWFSDHAVLVIVVLALLALLLLVTYFLRRQRRLERALAEREAAPPAATAAPERVAPPVPGPAASPAPAPAAAPIAPVNLNSASAEELQQLPGVGPRAAARIVEHREEYGPFSSVADLAKVEGFTPERIAGLGDGATV